MLALLAFILLSVAIAVGYQLHALVIRAHFDEAVKNQRLCKNCLQRLKQEMIDLKILSKDKKEKS